MKILIIGEINSDNLGDRAIYLTLEHLFKSEGYEVCGLDLTRMTRFGRMEGYMPEGPPDSFYLAGEELLSNSVKDNEISLKSILKFLQPNIVRKVRVLYSKSRNFLKHEEEWTRSIRNSDVVVFGGGALLTDNFWSFPLALLYASRLAKKFGVPYGCIGCSVGESFSFNGARWLKEFLRGSSFIIVRDPVSGARLKEFGVSQYRVFIDSAICTKDVIKIERKPFTGNLGINVLSCVRHPRVTRRDYYRYIEVMKNLVIRVAQTPQLDFKRVILFNTGGSADTHAGKFLHSQVKPRLSNVDVRVCRKMESLGELCHVVSQCDVVIGARLHSSIIAKSYGVPIIGIDWDKKVAEFYEMLNLTDFCFDYRTLDVEMIINALAKIKARNFHQDTNVAGHISEFKRLPSYICQQVGIKEKV